MGGLPGNVLIKMREERLLIHANYARGDGWLTDRVSTPNLNPIVIAGAGDSLSIVTALTLASGGTILEAACLGSLAAVVQVGRAGNTPLRSQEVVQELNQ